MSAPSNDHGGRNQGKDFGTRIKQFGTREFRTTQTASDQYEPVWEQCHGELGPPNVHVANRRKGMSDGIIEFGTGQTRDSAKRRLSSRNQDCPVRQGDTAVEQTTRGEAASVAVAFHVERSRSARDTSCRG